MVTQVLASFFGMAALDWLFARYTFAVTARQAARSSGYAAAFIILQGGVIVSYVHNPWMLIPAALGGAIGTYLSFLGT